MSWTQKQRAKIIARSYQRWGIQNKKVLDVGCGNGVVSKVLKEELNLNLLGTDIINYCKEEIPFKKMENAKSLPFDNLSFDYVMFNDVLHHSENVEALLLEGQRVGKSLLVFEVKTSPLFKIFDIVLNSFYHPKMPHPENFKSLEEWCFAFQRLGLHHEIGEVSCPVWYPFEHMVFKINGGPAKNAVSF